MVVVGLQLGLRLGLGLVYICFSHALWHPTYVYYVLWHLVFQNCINCDIANLACSLLA